MLWSYAHWTTSGRNVVVAAIASACLLAPTRAMGTAPPPAARIEATQGALVRAQPMGSWEPAAVDQPLAAGASIKTEAGSCTIRLPDGTTIVLEASSQAQLQASTDVNLEVGATTRVSRLDIKQGSIRVAIQPTARPLLVMASKDVFAAFRTGRGRAKVVSDGLIAIVDEGSARVAASGRWTPLSAGQYQQLHAHGLQPMVKALPPRPTFVQEPCRSGHGKICAIGITVGAASAAVGVRWSPSTAHHWGVTLSRDQGGADVVATARLDHDKTAWISEPLRSGSYWVTVQSFADEGLEGPSATRAVRVVRLLPDPGVTYMASEQVLLMPEGRRASLGTGGGLEVSWGGPDFAKPPPQFELGAQERRRLVRMRVEGDATDEADLVLERRTLRADVELGPKLARWPQDVVHVTVRVTDPSHRIDPKSIRPRLRAQLNNAPLQVPLAIQGDAWRAEIRGRAGRGPWVIRMEALDADDIVLGRGMLEVVGADRSGPTHLQW